MTAFYADDLCEIHLGEAQILVRRLLNHQETVHFVTDPPYGIGLDYGDTVDDWRPQREFWQLLYDHCNTASTLHMTVSNRHLPFWLREVEAAGWRYLHTSVYHNIGRAGGNANGQFAYAWEPLLSFSKTGTIAFPKRMLSDVFQHKGRRTTEHPAERELGVWRLFMSHLPHGLIVDPFLGSGTTLRAALDLGRESLGFERELHWCHQAALRCSQLSLFAGDFPNPAPEPEKLMEGMES